MRVERTTSRDDRTVTLAEGGPGWGADASVPVTGIRLQRYVALQEVGRGGMGCVLRAYDPKLQREVALKEVRPGAIGSEAAQRLVAEARAMAKLSHPNVVSVYDVETPSDGEFVLVMEYVHGMTLEAWLAEATRLRRDVIERFLAAGRGLAAAHAVGLLHRDFKPANVLVAGDATKVTDFGLAKPQGKPTDATFDLARDWVGGDDLQTELGVVLGTPRYMAPEQHRGEPLTPAADQYAFCVALWEALCGAAPFSAPEGHGRSANDHLTAQKLRGPPPWPSPSVPRTIAGAVSRGLDPDPANRWPSMDALMAVLRQGLIERRTSGRYAAVGAATLAVATVATMGWYFAAGGRDQRCTGAVEQLGDAWSDARHDDVENAMLAVEEPYARGVWERTSEELDAYARQWVASHVDACEATNVRRQQSSFVMDLRMACLHRAKRELAAITAVLADADSDVVRNAHTLLGGLTPLSTCSRVERLRAAVEPPLPEEQEAVESVRTFLAAAKASRKAGRYAQAQAALDAADPLLATVEYGPVHTEIAIERGYVLDRLGDDVGAEDRLRQAIALASRYRQRKELANAAIRLIYVVGYRQRSFQEGLQYRELAQGLASDDPNLQASARHNLAVVLVGMGELEEAEAQFRTALRMRKQVEDWDRHNIASTQNNLAVALNFRGKRQEAEMHSREALGLMESELGPDHPDVAVARMGHATLLVAMGRLEEAAPAFRRAIEAREAALGEQHPDAVGWRNDLGTILFELGRYEEAATEFRRVIDRADSMRSSDQQHVADSRLRLGLTLNELGDPMEAERELRAGLTMQSRLSKPGDERLVAARTALASFLLERGELREATALAELAWNHAAEASETQKAQAASVLGKAWWQASEPEARSRGRALVEQAAELYRQAAETTPSAADDLAEAQAWLGAHR